MVAFPLGGEIPTKVRSTASATRDLPYIAHEPAIGCFSTARDVAPQGLTETAYMKAESMWIGKVMGVFAKHVAAGSHVGNRVAAAQTSN